MRSSTRTVRIVMLMAWLGLAVGAVSLEYPDIWHIRSSTSMSPHGVVPDAPAPPAADDDRAVPVHDRATALAPIDVSGGHRVARRTTPLHERAQAARRAGRDDEALALYQAARAAGTLPADARVQLAWLLATRQRHAEAWDVAAALDDRARAHLEVRARVAAWAGRLETAVVLLPRWLEGAPRDADAWALLADVQRRLGEPAWRTSQERVLALRPDDIDARRTLARELAAGGDLAGAVARMEEVLREPGHTSADWLVIGHLHEQSARLRDAIAAYEEALARGATDPNVHRRLARVLRWTAQADRAVAAYLLYFDAAPEARQELAGEFGLALLHAGRAGEALRELEDAIAQDGADAAVWVAAAQAAAALNQPERVVSSLRGLRQLRAFSDDEARWFAGQLEAAGHAVEAVAAYREMLWTRAGDHQLWERLGDLEAGLGRPGAALEAYEQVLTGRVPAPASVWLKIARTAAAAGRHDRAADAYAHSVQGNPAGVDVLLEAARYLASAQEPARALVLYGEYLARSPNPSGMYVELARTALAAGRPLDALRWTEDGIAAGDRSPDLLFARAQALHLAGRPAESAAVLRMLVTGEPRNLEWRTWLAWTAQARGRSLEAYELLGTVLGLQGTRRADLLIARGDAAATIGDALRARASYAEALAAGADPRAVDERLQALPAPARVGAPVEIIRDTNGVELVRGGGQLLLHPGQVARVSGSWSTGHLAQDGGVRFEQRAVELRLDQFMPSPRLVLDGGVGLQQSAGATVPLWRAAARYRSPGGARAALMVFRETPWSVAAPLTDLRFSRIRNLSDLGARFNGTGATVSVELPLAERQAFLASTALRRYSDGNAAHQLYVQYQREVTAGVPAWVAVQPHVYVEGWRAARTAYFSPEQHVTAGVTLRAIADLRRWSLDAAVIPDVRFSEARRGTGLTLSGGLTRRIGRGSAGTQLMWFDDRRYGFRAWRMTAEIGIPVGK